MSKGLIVRALPLRFRSFLSPRSITRCELLVPFVHRLHLLRSVARLSLVRLFWIAVPI